MVVFTHLCVYLGAAAGVILLASAVNGRAIKKNGKFSDEFGNCTLSTSMLSEIKSYQPTVDRIAKEIVNGHFSGDTWNSLSIFIDMFGPRMYGSKSLEDSIDYMVCKLQEVGLENVHTENATLPRWQRGFESAQLLQPHEQNLPMLGLGSSVGTPRDGIIADVVVVESFDEFDELSENVVRGKIVLFVPKWVSYFVTVKYRYRCASVASRKGAVAALLRSITPFSIGSPHTGAQKYEDGVVKIPVAAITVEDTEMLLRMYRRGDQITIRLKMDDKNLDPYVSRNTIAELQGRTHSHDKKVVVVSGHLDR